MLEQTSASARLIGWDFMAITPTNPLMSSLRLLCAQWRFPGKAKRIHNRKVRVFV
jgi:hypothetical protein